jgi:mono/diheme cytochrome c family protein
MSRPLLLAAVATLSVVLAFALRPAHAGAPAVDRTANVPISAATRGPQVATKADGGSVVPTKRDSDEVAGGKLWARSCQSCHGEAGRGDGPAARVLVGGVPTLEGRVRTEDFDALVKVIQEGRGRMPAFAEDIDRHDSRRILDFLEKKMSGKLTPEPKAETAAEKGAVEEN